jgi:hypothetical protein
MTLRQDRVQFRRAGASYRGRGRAAQFEKKARAVLTGGSECRQLADEYRRLSELAVTVHEHTDLRLEEVKTQLGQLRAQLDSVQKFLKEVE